MKTLLVLAAFFAVHAAAGSEILNLSGRSVAKPGATIREALPEIATGAAARAALDMPCVILAPRRADFLTPALPRPTANDTFPTYLAKNDRIDRDEKQADERAARIARAIASAGVNPLGLGDSRQLATSLRTLLQLAVAPGSSSQPDVQTWIRTDRRVQAAFRAIYEGARRKMATEPNSQVGADFKRADPALAFLLGEKSERSEDAFRALWEFTQKYLR